MSVIVSTIATWGPAVYFSLGIANTLAGPSITKYRSGPTKLASAVFPDIFAKVEGLRKDILFYRTVGIPYAAALGTNFGPTAVLLVNHQLTLTGDQDAINFICKHEFSHIRTNDGFIASALATVASAISTCVVPYLSSPFPWWAAPVAYCVPLLVATNVYAFAMAVFEDRADRFASLHATEEELKGIERFIRAQIEVNKSFYAKYPQFFTPDGNMTLVFGCGPHAPLTERLQEIRWECQQRKITIDETLEPEKMEALKKFHRDTYQRFANLTS